MASLSLRHIYKKYPGGVTAVSDFNLEIKDKEFLVLVGPSGCGKSTTLRMIAGLEEISEGELFIGDRLVNDVAPKDRKIAMVFQNYALYPHMSVFENMAFGLKLSKVPKEVIKKKVEEAARVLDITHLLDRKPKALSGGQKQRVALGRAIVRDPQVFLLDEPLSNLDAKLRATMRTELTKLHNRVETTFIYVTHDQVEAMTMATRIVVMKDGLIQQVATPQNLYDNPVNIFVAGFIGTPQMNFMNGKLTKRGDDVYFVFEGNELLVPKEKFIVPEDSKQEKHLVDYIGEEVVAGLRPECIHDDELSISRCEGATLNADVDVTELMGAEIYLYLKVGEEGKMTARVSSRSTTRAGETIKIGFDMERMHFFDKDTEVCIVH
ncbi:MAG: sn-glycerol-3-phosphate ABC transporter ATP-binding protein UgpC [Clostridia bacterium]|nr:sn-glycerol-3-phosphate ABC transporter ATP-binding protein UgpC [Clostridia bacterium]